MSLPFLIPSPIHSSLDDMPFWLLFSCASLTSIYINFHGIFVRGSDEGSFFLILMKFHSSTRNKRDDNFTNTEYLKCYSNTEIQTAPRNCTRFFFLSISSEITTVKFFLPDDVRGSKKNESLLHEFDRATKQYYFY